MTGPDWMGELAAPAGIGLALAGIAAAITLPMSLPGGTEPPSRWTHPVCHRYYAILAPGRDPYLLVEVELEACCLCGDPTDAGIYIRYDPAVLPCNGKHERDER